MEDRWWDLELEPSFDSSTLNQIFLFFIFDRKQQRDTLNQNDLKVSFLK